MSPLYIIGGLLGFVILVGFYFIGQYNKIIKLKNIRKQSFADIDVQLKLRFDLIPNLIETVKGYASYEKETLENITKARTSFMNAGADDINGKIKAENMLSGALKSLFAVSERYPDLKANQNFLQMQTELSDIENKIAAARRFFNNSTQEYNSLIEMFPTNIVASMFGFKIEESFEVKDEKQRETVKVSF